MSEHDAAQAGSDRMIEEPRYPVCGACGGVVFRFGPAAALSVNIECRCGARWNWTPCFRGPARMEPINALAQGSGGDG